MPRRPRLRLPGVPLHLIQRGNNRSACFFAESDYQFYLEQLAERATAHGCAVHAYCLMTNHVHLLLTPATEDGVSMMMKGLGQRYVQYINRSYQRTGTLWEGRFRSCPVLDDAYLLTCSRYIELNPVRAAIVPHPAEFRWSSYRANAQGEPDPLLTPHSAYESLGAAGRPPHLAYRELFRDALAPGLVDEIRGATNGNFALGPPRFVSEIEQALGRRVTRGCPGRPAKEKTRM